LPAAVAIDRRKWTWERWLPRTSVGPTLPIGTQHYDLRQELVAGDTLQAYTSTGPITFAVTGYVFGV